MSSNDKKLSMPSKEAERAKALRDNLAKRKSQARSRDNRDDKDAKTEKSQ